LPMRRIHIKKIQDFGDFDRLAVTKQHVFYMVYFE